MTLYTAANFGSIRTGRTGENLPATDSQIYAFNQALLYLQTDTAAEAVLKALIDNKVQIFLLEGNDNANRFTAADTDGFPTIYWNPYAPLTVLTDQSMNKYAPANRLGVDSAAIGFIHEAYHAIDSFNGNLATHSLIWDKYYEDAAEKFAVNHEDDYSKYLHETVRTNHWGRVLTHLGNPTDHVTYVWDAAKKNVIETDQAESVYSLDTGAPTQNSTWITSWIKQDLIATSTQYGASGNKISIKVTYFDSKSTPTPVGLAVAGNSLVKYGASTFNFGTAVFSATGSTRISNTVWTDASGATYELKNYQAGTGVGNLFITGGKIGAGSVEIDDFNLFTAETDPHGFFGVHLASTIKVVSTASLGFTLSIDAPSQEAQAFDVKFSGALPSDFEVLEGATSEAINGDGSFTITLAAGMTSASFSLVDITKADGASDIANEVTFHLSASLFDANGSGSTGLTTADDFSVAYQPKNSDAASAPKNMALINGTNGRYQGDGGDDEVLAAFVDNDIELGNSVNDSIVSGAGTNTIFGGSGNDVIALQGTHDWVGVGSGHTTVNGGSGLDTIVSNAGSAIINAHNGTDVILLGSGTNEVYADSQASLADAITQAATDVATGNKGDLISVLDGNDTIVSGLGNDLVNVGNAKAVIVLGPGQDTVLAGWDLTDGSGDWSTTNDPNVVTVLGVVASAEAYVNPYLQPYNGNHDIIDQTTLPSGASNVTVFGGSGNDIIILGNGNNYVEAGTGNTKVDGGMGNDTIVAGSGSDTLRGGGGNTYIVGGSGTAQIWGGDGNNTIIGGSGNATISSAAIDSEIAVNGRWDNDTLSTNYVFTGSGDDVVVGSAGHDTLVAGSGNSTLQGGLGEEYIVGGSGKDLLIGGDGKDTLVAGGGYNTLLAGSGSTASSWLYGGDSVDLIEGGGGTNYLWAGDGGTAGSATSVMGSASDASSTTTIYGGLGVDVLQGGAGSTFIQVGDGGTAQAATSVIATTGATTVYGGAGVDFIQGGTGSNVLYAGDGGTDDAPTTVLGMSGQATLSGGAGTDLLWDNFSGEDLLIAGSGNDTLSGKGQDTFIAGSGYDVVQNFGGAATIVLGANDGAALVGNLQGGSSSVHFVDGLKLTGIAGAVQVDGTGSSYLALSGAAGEVSLQGAMTGALTSVTFDSGDSVSVPTLMAALIQNDQVVTNNGRSLHVDVGVGESFASTSGVRDTISSWGANETIHGSSSSSGDFIYSGGDGADIISGIGSDTIVSVGARATVQGGLVTLSGANSIATGSNLTAYGAGDTLVGGAYPARFYVNDSSVTVVSNNTHGGSDTVTSTVNYVLPASGSVNTLVLSGSADIEGTANNGTDTLWAGAGHDTLVSGTGVDTLVSGGIATTIVIHNSADFIWYNGSDISVISDVSYTLPYGANMLTLTGNAALTATANDRADTIVSNTGIDTLIGGGGHDLFVVNNAADVVIESSSAANDTLQASVNITLPTNVNTLVLTGSAALTGQANAATDTLVSNSGVDTLIGGAGSDTFLINNSADVVLGASATTGNIVIASVNVTLPVNVNSLVLTGTAALEATGNSAADILYANLGNDSLVAVSTAAATTLVGGAGDDLFVINNAADVVQSASTTSNDTIQSSVSYTAATNVNTLVLTGSANLRATANDAGDTLVSNSGVDTLVGGAGNDVFIVNNAADVLLNVGAGDTIISSISTTVPSATSTFIASGSNSISITTNSGNDYVAGNAGNDTLVATSGQDTLVAGTGIDAFVAGSGNDLFIVNNVADVVSVSGAHGADTIESSVNWTLPAGVNTLVLTGNANLAGRAPTGDNLIVGNAGNDTLSAGSGSDTLTAGAGVATLVGGSGSDTFVINNAADSIVSISSASGNAVVSSVSYTMQANVSFLTLTGTADLVGIGNASNNTITANSGNDTLIAGSGVALLIGGMGADLFVVDNVADVVSESNYWNKGFADTVQSSVSYTLPGTVDNLVLTGSANLMATGNANADVIIGNAGNDTLQAGVGDDTLVSGSGVTLLRGGAGNDTYVVNNAGDTIVNASTNDNVLMSSVSITLPTNINTLRLTGSADLVGTSNGADDWLEGNDGADKLVALGGNDTLVAGAGVTTLVGGSGNDTFIVNNFADVVSASSTNNVMFSSASYVLPTHVDSLTLTGAADISATGNGDADTLTAGGGNDTLIAGSGIAVMNGGSGPTTFVVNNVADVVQNASAAVGNSLQSSVSFTLPTNVNLLTLTGAAAITGTGNAAADTLVGNAGLDTLVSGSGNDLFILGNAADKITNAFTSNSDTVQSAFNFVLPTNVSTLVLTGSDALTGQANSGNDTLISNDGVDTLTGGAGDDTFIVNNALDVVQGASATSSNTIIAGVSVTLPVNVNALVLTGDAALQATGNLAADILYANDGDDTLVAVSTGAVTTLVGGAGNDLFVINNSSDVIQNTSTTSSDTIWSSANFTAAANVNTLVLTGTGNLQATANGAGDTLVSNAGVDTLVGGAGNDVFVVNNSADVLLNVGAGDTIESSVNYSVATPGVTLVLTGAASISGAVFGSGDTLSGGDGIDTLTASGPNQTLVGGAGGDVFVVNSVSDVVEMDFPGSSTIVSCISYSLPDFVDTLVLTGSANLSASGNSDFTNVLIANAGNDQLTATGYQTTIIGGSGTDTLKAGANLNVIYAGSGGTVAQPTQILGNASGTGALTQSTIYGGSGNDIIWGGAGTDVIYAGTGTSTIYGGSGHDTIVAGSGSALLLGNSDGSTDFLFNPGFGQATIGSVQIPYETGINLDFGPGIAPSDLTATAIQTPGSSGPQVSLLLTTGAGSILISSGLLPGSIGEINFADSGPSSLAQLMSAAAPGIQVIPFNGSQHVIVSAGDFQNVEGDSTVSQIYAFGSGDIVAATASLGTYVYVYGDRDTVTGRGVWVGGNDDLVYLSASSTGGTVAGTNDTIVASSNATIYLTSAQSATTVVEASAGSTGISINADTSYVLPDNVQALALNVGFDSLSASSNAQGGILTAYGNYDTLTGGSGEDLLIAYGNHDLLIGGSGAENYVLESATDSIRSGGGDPSRDTIDVFFNYALDNSANTLIQHGNSATGIANSGNDSLVSNGGEDDTLIGGAGNDTFSSVYDDRVTMIGGSGNNTFVVWSDEVVIDAYGAASNTIEARGSYVLPVNVNTLVLIESGISGTANGANDLISIGSLNGSDNYESNDTLVAGVGNDTLAAGATGGNTFIFNAGFGQDQITGTSTDGTIDFGAGISRSSLTFSAVLGADGAAPTMVISGAGGTIMVQGGAGPGAINAVNFADGSSYTVAQLLAPSGDTTIVGPHGNLILSSSNNDLIVGGTGLDTILAWGNADTLTAGAGGAVITAAGVGDLVTGGSGTDRLEASGDNTTLVGGSGFETFVIDNSSVKVVPAAGNSNNGVVTSVSYTVPSGMTNMTLAGGFASDIMGYANDLNDVITGGAALNTFVAGAGVDTFIGGSGNNLFYVNNVNDVVQVAANGSQNEISTTANYTLPENVDFLDLNGASLVGTGNDQADTLRGSGQNDTLVSGSGVDTLLCGNYATAVVNNSADVVQNMGVTSTVVLSSVNFTRTGSLNIILQLTGDADLTAVDQRDANANRMQITGNAGNDTLIGMSGDELVSGTGVDMLVAAAGSLNISFDVNNAADVVVAAPGGGDTVDTSVSYTLPEFASEMVVSGTSLVGTSNTAGGTLIAYAGGHDTLVGGSGDDQLTSYTADNTTSNFNTLVVGSGFDQLSVNGGDTIVFNPGFGDSVVTPYDQSSPRALNVRFGAGVAAGDLTATAVFDGYGYGLTVSSDTGTTTLEGAITAGPGMTYQFAFASGGTLNLGQFLGQVGVEDTTLSGAFGNFVLQGEADISIAGGSEQDTLLAAGAGDTLTGGSGNEVLEAMGANDSLVGGIGDDTLMAFGSNDTLVGGAGLNTFVAGTGGSAVFVINSTSDTIQVQSNPGADTIESAFSYALPTSINALVLTGSAALTGTANSGADTLVSNTGVDTLVGGRGADLFVLNNAADVVTVGASHGVDTIMSFFNDTLAANVANLVLAGTSALVGTGNSTSDTLRANDAGDTLVAGTGVATMIGGAGNDLFVVNNAADSVQSAAGVDTISSSATFTLPANVNTLVMTGAGSIRGTGNAANDLLTASTSTGKVTLVAGVGADTLVSGTGIDSLVGGTGNDLFIISNASDVVTVAATSVADTIQSSFNDTLAANVSTLVLTGSTSISGAGNAMADTIYGNAGSDTLSAGSGLATLVGGTGNNKFVVNNLNDVVVSNSAAHGDTISSSVTYTLPSNINALVLTGSAAMSGTGNTGNDLLTASTSSGAVTLNAGNGADTLVAGSGADVLVSGTGVDSLVAGTGSDLFILNNAADVVSVGGTHGTDTIQAGFNDTLAAGVGVLVLTGSASLMGTGNSLADTLTANSGNDTLVAGTGAATMIGGAGNDLFIINSTLDAVNVASSAVSDTISSSVSYTLPTNVQYLMLTGSNAISGTGNAGTSLILGGTGAETLNGGAGIAVLEAGTAGAQVLKATSNQAALVGGGAADSLTGGAFKDFFAAGKIGDTITTGATANVIAVNKGDGATVIAPTTGASNVLSLGAGIDTEALTLTKSGNNLVLNDGVSGDSITFTNWFLAASDQTTKTLQVIEAASASYSSSGADALRNKPIEEFNFTTLVSQFTAANSPSGWALSQKEAADTIASSATQAYGGDLAYYEGMNGNLTGMNLSAAQSTLTNASYATGLQTIDAWSGISGGAMALSVVAGGSSNATAQASSVQPELSDSRMTTEPLARDGMMRAAYVDTTALTSAMGSSGAVPVARQAVSRTGFEDLWRSMHSKLDLADASHAVAAGAESHDFDVAVDPVAMLSGAGATFSGLRDRRIAVPKTALHEA